MNYSLYPCVPLILVTVLSCSSIGNLLITTVSHAQNLALNTELIAHWDFENITSSTVRDVSGHGLEGVLQGQPVAVTSVEGQGKALQFDGVDDAIVIADHESLNPQQITVAVWLKQTGPNGTILQKGSSSSLHYRFYTSWKGLNIQFKNKNHETITVTFGKIAPNQWQHAAVTWDNAVIRAYIDGVEVATQPYTGTGINNSTIPLKVGTNRWDTHPFAGELDDLRLYARALTSTEIAELGQRGTDENTPPNHPPIAMDDDATTQANTSIILHVLANDHDVDGDSLTITNVSAGNNGTGTISRNQVSYTPATSFTGTDTFTYTIEDGRGGTATGVVTLTVQQVDGPTDDETTGKFVDGSVSSSGDGSISAPFKTIQEALNLVQAGETLIIAPGEYAETLRTSQSGQPGARITVMAADPGTVIINYVGRVLDVTLPYYTFGGLIFDGGFGDKDIVRVRTQGDFLEFRNNVVRNGARDGIDLGTNLASGLPTDFLDGVIIEGCEIHHLLWHDGIRKDAHGIVAGGVRQFVVRDSEVYIVSGDALQLQDGGWDEVLVENATFWNRPLPNAIAGFPAGIQPGENAIDTKQDNRIPYRGRLTIRGGNFHGWHSDLIGNASAINLKERVEVLIDGASVYNNDIGFRLRGRSGDNGAYVTVQNTVLFNNQRAVRYEDQIKNLHLHNNTWGLDNVRAFQSAGGTGTGFEVENNLFISDSIPGEATAASNLAVEEREVKNPTTHDYHLREGSLAIDSGIVVEGVDHDKDGTARTLPYDVGAYEFSKE